MGLSSDGGARGGGDWYHLTVPTVQLQGWRRTAHLREAGREVVSSLESLLAGES